MQRLSILLGILLVIPFLQAKKPLDEQHCEGKIFLSISSVFTLDRLVCIKTVNKFAETLSADDKSSVEKIEKGFKSFCKKVKVDSKEHRLVGLHKQVMIVFNKFRFI